MKRLNKPFVLSTNNVLGKRSFKYARNILELIYLIIKTILESDLVWFTVEEDTEEL